MLRRLKIALALAAVAVTLVWGYPAFSAFRWTSRLRTTAAGADRLRIWEAGPIELSPDRNRILFETTDTNLIAQVLGGLEGRSESYLHCMCFGAPGIVFYRGEQPVAALGRKHGKRLLWCGNSHGDVTPTTKSLAFIKNFLSKHGRKNAEVQ